MDDPVPEDICEVRFTKGQPDGDVRRSSRRHRGSSAIGRIQKPLRGLREDGRLSPRPGGRSEPFGVVKRFVFTHCQIGLHQRPTAALNAPIFVRTTIAFEDLYDY